MLTATTRLSIKMSLLAETVMSSSRCVAINVVKETRHCHCRFRLQYLIRSLTALSMYQDIS